LKIVTFLLLLCFGGSAIASVAVDAQRKRELLETYAHRVTTEMCLITRNAGDRAASQRLQNILSEATTLSRDIAGIWPDINSEWQKTAQFVADNKAAADSGDVVNVLPNLQIRQEALYQAFDQDRPASRSGADEQSVMVMLDSLERMLASYVMFQTSMFGGHGFTEVGIESQSKRFDEALASLHDEKLKTDIAGKWKFVKGALLAYNEKAAVFIVDRTGRSIRDLLVNNLQMPQVAAE